MRKSVLISICIVMLLLITKAQVLPLKKPIIKAAEDTGGMEHELNAVLSNEPALNGAIAGISIRSAETGELLYNHLGDVRLRPASSMKLLTAAAALSTLGEDYRFKTEVLTNGRKKGKTLHGNLYLKGKGDPTLLKSDLDTFAKKLHDAGIEKVDGDLIGDDTWYDDVRYSPDLVWSDEHTYYGAQISALTLSPDKDYDSGSVIVDIIPSKNIGENASFTLSPPNHYISIKSEVKTVSKDGENDIQIERTHGTNSFTIKGTIPIHIKKERQWLSVWDPTNYTLALFKQSLQAEGIKLTGNIKKDITPGSSKNILSHSSMPLSKLLVPFLKLSNNGHAEVLVKEMGKVKKGEGSWEKGLEVLESELPKFGVNTDTLVIRDGSGISHVELIPANELSMLLYTVQKEIWFPAYLKALPIAGEKDKMVGGTLRNRLKGELTKGKVKAKTGTLSTVTSLSGYIETKNGKTLIVTIILNNLTDEDIGKKIEDRIVTIIANQ